MNAKKPILGAALALIALTLGICWFGFDSARRAKSALATLATNQMELDARIKAVQQRIASSAKRENAIRSALETAKGGRLPARVASKPEIKPSLPTLLATHPDIRALYEKSFRANLPVKYLPFYHTLGLSPDSIEKFQDLLTERDAEAMDLQAAAEAQGLSASDPAITALRQQQDSQLREAEVALLGNSGYQELQQFNRIEPLEGFVAATTGYMPVTAPFTSSQRDQLLAVLAQSSSAFQAGGAANLETIDQAAALAQAIQFLNAPQLAALQASFRFSQIQTLLTQFYQPQAPPNPSSSR